MSDTVIRVENLSKRYIIGHQQQEKYTALRDVLANTAKGITQRFNPKSRLRQTQPPFQNPNLEEFWALKDVSFEVKRGDRIGIIGRNGAGKSTLLKILSRITEPTEGRISIKGRVASLLEVGTGFHPELTGRENIFLNGAILGMSRVDIKRKFDEIVAFAEVERFLDTPVKRYSSGMYVRLAFAVAAHLEPEILIVDEVLAVGDAQFQKKCLGKMEDVSKQGRTVLFVSHNMGTISSLCNQAILLENGQVANIGLPSEIILNYYTSGHLSPSRVDFTKTNKKIGDDYAELLEAHIENSQGNVVSEVDMSEDFFVSMKFRILKHRKISSFYTYPQFNFLTSTGETAFISTASRSELQEFKIGEYIAVCKLPGNLLNSDTYFVDLGLASCDKGLCVHFYEKSSLCFHVKETLEKTLHDYRNGYTGLIPGSTRPRLKWQVSKMD